MRVLEGVGGAAQLLFDPRRLVRGLTLRRRVSAEGGLFRQKVAEGHPLSLVTAAREALRLLTDEEALKQATTNIELKTVDNTCNPYLAFGAIIAAVMLMGSNDPDRLADWSLALP